MSDALLSEKIVNEKEIVHNFRYFLDHTLPITVHYVGESYCDKNFYFKRDCHDCYSLEYIVSGSGTLKINNQIYYPKAGDIFFLPKNSKHEYFCSKESVPWHKLFFSFDGRLAERFVNEYLIKDLYVFENTELYDSFKTIMETANRESYSQAQRNDMILPEIFKIFLKIKRTYNLKPSTLAEKIKVRLDHNLQKKYTINDLAKSFAYSANHIINVFQSEYGETPYQYIARKRIELACEYLTTTSMSISKIAEILCYSDSQYFSKCFKKATGYSPYKYRKEKVNSNKSTT